MKGNETPLYASPALGRSVTEYSAQHSTPLPKHITEFHASIATSREDSMLMSSNFQSQWNYILARSIGAKRVLEIGVYVGYSAMVWSHAVGPEGRVTGLEFEPDYAKLAKDAFVANGVNNVDIVIGPAAETLPKLSPSEPYDIVFLDADKTGYPGYLKQLLEASRPGAAGRLLRPGALIISDNVLRRGLVADINALGKASLEDDNMKHVVAVREFNDLCVSNPRLETFLVPLWDGVNITRLID